jgi:hypothetical protein
MMTTTLKKLVITAAIAAPLALSVSAVVPSGDALAAPITCKGNKTVEKGDRGDFYCATDPGKGTPDGVERTKNPNDKR